MPESILCCLVLLVAIFSGLPSVSETISQDVCQGDNVPLFENITLANDSTVNLYINGKLKTLIRSWQSGQNQTVLPEYVKRVFLDEYGTIWIQNIQYVDKGKYLLQHNSEVTKSEVEINVMVAPMKHCKPEIKKQNLFLTAHISDDGCGTPTASVHWLYHPDIIIVSMAVVKITPEKEVGTYYACAQTPAFRCVKNLTISDYCQNFVIEGHNSLPASSCICAIQPIDIAVVTIVSLLSIIVVGGLLLRRKNGKKKHPESSALVEMLQLENKDEKKNLLFENAMEPLVENINTLTNAVKEMMSLVKKTKKQLKALEGISQNQERKHLALEAGASNTK